MSASVERAGDGHTAMVARAQGCLLGQLAGDALGSLVEFEGPDEIRRAYPGGVRDLADGGSWNTIAGQPTDDSEMALALARTLIERNAYDPAAARAAYVAWLDSGPFDYGTTVSSALRGRINPESQANGAMMRISPVGIFGAKHDLGRVAEWARLDAMLTHPNPVCVHANALYAMAIAHAIRSGPTPAALYRDVVSWAAAPDTEPSVIEAVLEAAESPPLDYTRSQGWVLIAFRNALWQLTHAPSLEVGIVDTVMQGGDTDTNAAICGALLGAVHGREAIPARWADTLLACRPGPGDPRVHRPRPACYWPVDASELAERLVA